MLDWEVILSFLQEAFHALRVAQNKDNSVCLKPPMVFGIGVVTLKKEVLDLSQS